MKDLSITSQLPFYAARATCAVCEFTCSSVKSKSDKKPTKSPRWKGPDSQKCPYKSKACCGKWLKALICQAFKRYPDEWLAEIPEEVFVKGMKAHGYSGELVKSDKVTF